MFGKRRMLVASMTAFGAGAVISAVSNDVWLVVTGRAIQGLGGVVLPLCFGIARDLFPPKEVARSVGLLSAMTGVGGSFGLVIGGVIADRASWHWIFWISALMGASSALATQSLIAESPTRTGGRVDVRGALVLCLGLALPLFGISRVAQWGWLDPRTLALIGTGATVLAAWTKLEKRTAEPLASMTLLRSRNVLMTNVATMFIGISMMAVYVVVPQFAQTPTSSGYGFGANATGAGLLLLPGSVLMMALGPVSAALGTRFGHRIPLALGGIIAAAALALLGFAHGTQLEVAAFSALAFGGIGLAFAALPNLILDSVDASKTGEAAGFNFVVLRAASSLGAQIAATILAGSIAAGSVLPTDSAYGIAFFVSALAGLAATAAALGIPRAGRRPHRQREIDEVVVALQLPTAPIGSAPLREPR
jgi:MFS family permease